MINLTSSQLRQAADFKEKIAALEAELAGLMGGRIPTIVQPKPGQRAQANTTKLRTATPGDEKALAELNVSIHEFHVKHHPSFFKPGDLKRITSWLRDMIKKPTVQIWIAERSGLAVGYVIAILRERPEEVFSYARKWLEIDQIAVLPEYQRNGIGRSLVQSVLESARKQKIRDVELTSWSFNGEAHKAFRRLGFAPRIVRFGVKMYAVTE